ncbi:unnamed protein product, partial [marine sediment metagenome]
MSGKQNNKKDYHSIILAALLHDIGKFLHRGSTDYHGTHQNASTIFLDNFKPKLKNDSLYDFELVRTSVKYHHSLKKEFTSESDYYKNGSENEKIWRFIALLKDADSYSCKERDIEQQRRKDHAGKVAPLDSIFSQIALDGSNYGGTKTTPKYHRYRIGSINPLFSFPEEFTVLEKNEIPNHVKTFEDNLPNFSKLTTFDNVLTVWLSLLEQYTWCIPSDTRYEESDVSLFDHLRSTSAIAACLFKQYIRAISEGK